MVTWNKSLISNIHVRVPIIYKDFMYKINQNKKHKKILLKETKIRKCSRFKNLTLLNSNFFPNFSYL